MADAPLNIKVILASTREGRNGEKIARWFHGIAAQHEGINAELVDLLDWPLPFFNAAKGPSSGGDCAGGRRLGGVDCVG